MPLSMRQIDLHNGVSLRVAEGTHLVDEAGAVLWDAGLVLIKGFLDHQRAIKGDRPYLRMSLCCLCSS